MKVFFCACTAFLVSVALVAASAVYTGNFTDELASLAGKLPETADEKDSAEILGVLEKMTDLWSRRKFGVSLSVGHRELGEIEAAILTVEAAVRSGSDGNYAAALVNLSQKIDSLAKSEKLSLDGIL
ncbi:MAG: DUF4363 family protein [Clostridia bacterium]|nr:DUF4363 family protein [Clostridia bacterium]